MRTLFEIIESAKGGERPSHEECYWALMVVNDLLFFARASLMDLSGKTPEQWGGPFGVKFKAEQEFQRCKRAILVPPEEWLNKSEKDSEQWTKKNVS